MTLRARLLWVTAAMVVTVAFTLTGLSLNSVMEVSVETAAAGSEGAALQVQALLLRRLSTPAAKAAAGNWDRLVESDGDLGAALEQTMAQSRSVVEINVANRTGTVLASSNPRRRGSALRAETSLSRLRGAGPWERMSSILTRSADYETRLTLGVSGETAPLFTVQIVLSPVLLRDATLPRLRAMVAAALVALILAIGLAWFSASLALRPLGRISHLIDDIASGKPPDARNVVRGDSPELRMIESKLSLLGEHYRDARADASQLRSDLEGAMEKLDAGSRGQLEAQIGLARRLTAINSLTRGVAHEIKNPLNSIALRLEMLREKIAEDSPGTEGEFSILSEEVMRLDRVVRTFLDFNRPVELDLTDVDVAQDVERMLALLEPEMRARRINVTLTQPERRAVVKADAGLLRQALLNIAVNGVEAMEDGGTLAVTVSREGDFCAMRIADNGSGISPDQLERIFQLYFTTKPQGTGIGLAMAYRAVHLHGGTIEVKSEPGKGTAFEIRLPLVRDNGRR